MADERKSRMGKHFGNGYILSEGISITKSKYEEAEGERAYAQVNDVIEEGYTQFSGAVDCSRMAVGEGIEKQVELVFTHPETGDERRIRAPVDDPLYGDVKESEYVSFHQRHDEVMRAISKRR